MNIDFIKWMCEKAGWEMIIYSDDDYKIIPDNNSEDEDFFTSIGHLMAHYAWKALLTSAIEGVNMSDDNPFTIEISDMVCAYEIMPEDDGHFRDPSVIGYNKAKLSILQYIYEQEKKA